MVRELLLDIARDAVTVYISDLKGMNSYRVARAVDRLIAEDYPVSEWRDAYEYLLGEEAPQGVSEAAEIRSLLVQKLRRRNGVRT